MEILHKLPLSAENDKRHIAILLMSENAAASVM